MFIAKAASNQTKERKTASVILGGSRGLNKWGANADNWGYYLAYMAY